MDRASKPTIQVRSTIGRSLRLALVLVAVVAVPGWVQESVRGRVMLYNAEGSHLLRP